MKKFFIIGLVFIIFITSSMSAFALVEKKDYTSGDAEGTWGKIFCKGTLLAHQLEQGNLYDHLHGCTSSARSGNDIKLSISMSIEWKDSFNNLHWAHAYAGGRGVKKVEKRLNAKSIYATEGWGTHTVETTGYGTWVGYTHIKI